MAAADDKFSTTERRARRAMPSRLQAPRPDLDRLPQFEPDHTFRRDEAQHQSVLPFPESLARQKILDALPSAMKPHVREALLGKAMLPIATFESRSLRRLAYDRKRASKIVKEVLVTLLAFQQALERIVKWRQFDRYLEKLFVADRKLNKWQHDEREGKRLAALRDDLQPTLGHTAEWKEFDQTLNKLFVADRKLSSDALLEALKLGDLYRAQFRARSPRKLLEWLKFLEPLLTLALERLAFQPGGEAQQDKIAQEFADAMVLAWRSATGALPSYSKSKTKPSAFQRLLKTINREIFEPEIRSRTDFRHHAVSAVDRAHKRAKGTGYVRE